MSRVCFLKSIIWCFYHYEAYKLDFSKYFQELLNAKKKKLNDCFNNYEHVVYLYRLIVL